MSRTWSELHSPMLTKALFDELKDWLGTPYGSAVGGQTKGVEADCSGLIIQSLANIGWEIADKTADQLMTVGPFVGYNINAPQRMRIDGPGPAIHAIGVMPVGTITHIGLVLPESSRFIIHSTDDVSFVADNGGVDGVMITKYDTFLTIASSLGTLVHAWLRPYWWLTNLV